MWAWFVGGYAALIAVLIAYSAHVAISCHNKQRRADAFRIPRTTVWTPPVVAEGRRWLAQDIR